MILADALPDPNSYASMGWVIVILAAIVAILNQGLGVIGKWRGLQKGEERKVTITAEMPSKQELDKISRALSHDVEKLWTKVGGVERGVSGKLDAEIKALRDERREDIRLLHHEINEVAKKVSSVETSNTMQNQRLSEINAKLDRVIERQVGE